MTHEQAMQLSVRAERVFRAMTRCGENRIRAEKLARAWVRIVDRICDYKRERAREVS